MTKDDHCKVINEFTNRMSNSGYSQERISDLVIPTLIGHEKRIASLEQRGRRRNRTKKMMKEKRRLKMWKKRTGWFKEEKDVQEGGEAIRKKEEKDYKAGPKKKEDKPTKKKEDEKEKPLTIMFVPRTNGGMLANRLKEAESKLDDITDTKVRIVERCGVQLAKLLTKSNPWQPTPCNFQVCQACKGPHPEDNPKCTIRGVTYVNTCLTCKQEGVESVYIGETSRTLRERYGEHHGGREEANNHMHSHEATHHGGVPANYQAKALKSYKTPMERQIAEAIKIKLLSKTKANIMNNKLEYNACILPELCTLQGVKIKMTAEEEEKIKHEEEMKIQEKQQDMKRKAVKMIEQGGPKIKKQRTM